MKMNRKKLILAAMLALVVCLTACAALAKPAGLAGSASDIHSLSLSWDTVEDATGYRITVTKDGAEGAVLQTDTDQNFVTLENVPYSSTGYCVTVSALQEKDGKVTVSDASEVLKVSPAAVSVATVEAVQAHTGSDGTVLVSWSQGQALNKNADGSTPGISYSVWCGTDPDGEFELLSSGITEAHYVDKGADPAVVRYYYVTVTEHIDGDGAVGSPSGTNARSVSVSQQVSGLTAAVEDNSAVVLSWDACESELAVTYNVYEGTNLLAEGISDCTYRHEGLTDLTTYDYRVEVTLSTAGVSTGTGKAAEVSASTSLSPVANPAASSPSTSAIDIKWDAYPADQLTGSVSVVYNVYTGSSENGEFTLLAENLTETGYRHSELTSGASHFYKIEAVVTVDGTTHKATTAPVKGTVRVPTSDEPFMGTAWLSNGMLLHEGASHQMSGFVSGNATKMAAVYDTYAGLFPDSTVSVVVGPISSLIVTDPELVKRIPDQGLDKNEALQTDRVNFVNLKQTFLDHKDEYLFFKSDHHWTQRGAYYAYQQFALSVGLTPRPVDDFEVKILNTKYIGSMASFTGDARVKKFYDTVEAYMPSKACTMTYSGKTVNYCINTSSKTYMAFINGDLSYAEITVAENPQDKVILVLKDSYGNAFIPFLTEHYGKIYVVDPRYADFTIQSKFAGITFDDIVFVYNNYSANSSAWVKYLNKLISQ